jgi:hypothetical protein
MTRKENEIKNTRQPYRKPQLEQVRLLVDEAILTACKNPATVGKNELGCKPGTGKCKNVWMGT